jgi:hypothetical protein
MQWRSECERERSHTIAVTLTNGSEAAAFSRPQSRQTQK